MLFDVNKKMLRHISVVNVVSLVPLLWVIKSTLYSIVDTVHMAWNIITSNGVLTT